MGTCCNNNFQGIVSHNCGCRNANNTAIIIAAIVALILINILNEETAECVGGFLQATGDLVSLGVIGNCFNNVGSCGCCNCF